MSTKHQKLIEHRKKIIAICIAVLVLGFLGFRFFTKSYPIAVVSWTPIYAKSLDQSWQIGRKFDPSAQESIVLDQLIMNRKKELLAKTADVSGEIKYYKTGNLMDYNKFLNDYFSGSEKIFIQYVAEPQAYDAALRIKYNDNFGLNNDSYNKAQNIRNQLNDGKTFDELAKTYSDDKISGQVGGDIGFVTQGQLLPELEKVVMNAKIGEVKKEIVVTRLGYHILYPVEQTEQDGQKVWHIKHILIKTQGYDSWLNSQMEAIGVHKFISI